MSEAQVQTREKETVTIVEPPKAAQAAPLPSRQELKEKENWSEKELDAAEKRGMIAKPGEEKKAAAEVKTDGTPAPDASKLEEKKEEAKAAPQPRGTLPDFTMTPEQEKVFLSTFGAGTQPRALYFRMKNERHSRQAAEALARELKAKLEVYEKEGVRPAGEDPAALEDDDRPLTPKALRELQQKEAAKIAREQQAQQERGQLVMSAQKEQEDFAKAIYPDFDKTVDLAKDLIQNIETLIPEKHKQAKALQQIRQLQIAAANADKYGPEDYHAAYIAYDLGQLHPQYGKGEAAPAQKESVKETKAAGGLSAEQLRRIEENANRRASSASVSAGGGRRTVAPEEVSAQDLVGMDYKKRAAFKEKYPEHYGRLMRAD